MDRPENADDWYPEDDEDFSESPEEQEAKVRQWYGK